MRIGLGYDIHRTTTGDSIWLGGVKIPAPFSLVGHSDADVLLHAITDAILGALADFDIGHYFPPSDAANKNRPSRDFLTFALEKMRARQYAIGNIDCNIICETPRIAPIREDIRRSLSTLMHIDLDQVSVKGRSNEKVDATGRGEAVICQASVLLTPISGNR
jgi:2-C-methyl-D-erythritol 2,4-cyclodiphosphate synthase